MNATVLLAAIAFIAIVYVALPVFAEAVGRFRGIRRVRCPETGREVRVALRAGRTALASVFGTPAAWIDYCSLWPERRGCRQGCAAAAAATPAEDRQPEPAAPRG